MPAVMNPPRSHSASAAGEPGAPTVENSVRPGTMRELSLLSAHFTRCKMGASQCSSGPDGAFSCCKRIVTYRLSDVQRPKFVVGLRHFHSRSFPRIFLQRR